MVIDAAGADLVVLPELWLTGYFHFDEYEKSAEPLDGDTVTAGREWARTLGCHLHLGSIVEKAPDSRLYNTSVLIDPDGAAVHSYRKMHVFGYRSRERDLITPGNTLEVTETALGPLAASTCYDLRFPELWRVLVDRGAKLVVVPSAWPARRIDHWRLFTAARAVEQQVFVAACNAVGEQAGERLGGCSRVVDPWGEVLVEGGSAEDIAACEVDMGVVDQVRAEFPVLADRRLDLRGGEVTSQEGGRR